MHRQMASVWGIRFTGETAVFFKSKAEVQNGMSRLGPGKGGVLLGVLLRGAQGKSGPSRHSQGSPDIFAEAESLLTGRIQESDSRL